MVKYILTEKEYNQLLHEATSPIEVGTAQRYNYDGMKYVLNKMKRVEPKRI